jgi:hypothetical protein
MDHPDLMPPGPPPHLDVADLRDRVRTRARDLRRRSVRRTRGAMAACVVTVLVTAGFGLTRRAPRHRPSRDA